MMIRAISHAVRGCVKLPVMMRPRGVGCVAQALMVRPRGVGCVRVTRSIMPGHVRQSVASVATPVVVRMTAAVPIAPIAAMAATVADGPVTTTAALSRSRNRSNRARDTHAEDRHRCIPFNVPHAFISCGNDSAFALSGWSTYKRFNGSLEVSCFFGLAGSMSPWGTEPAAGNHHARQCLRLAQLDRYRSILGDVPLETIAKAVGLSAISLSNSSRSRPTPKPHGAS